MSGPTKDGEGRGKGMYTRMDGHGSSGARPRRRFGSSNWRWGWAVAAAALAVAGCTEGRAPEPGGAVQRSTALRGAFMHGQTRGGSPSPAGKAAAAAPAGVLLTYFGGRVVSNMQVVQVLYGTGSYLPQVTTDIGNFYQGVLNSAYVDWLSEYNTTGLPSPTSNQSIGRGSFLSQVTITPSAANNGSTIDDSNIQSELALQIQSGNLPAPTKDAGGNNNTYYAIFFPHGKTITSQGEASCQVFCAYHSTIASVPGFGEVYYGVQPDFQAGSGCESGCGNAPTAFGNVTQVASHEMVETITDAEVGLAQTFAPPLAWYDQGDNLEIGDICNDQHATVTGSNGTTYDVQTEYSNAAGACVATRSPALSITPTLFEGGKPATGTANLLALATSATTVTLTSSAPSVVAVPASVVVPAGSSSATFSLTSTAVSAQTSVNVTATFPTTPPTTSVVTLTVLPSPTVSALALAPPSVAGGGTSTGTVTLSGPAPATGSTVNLTSNSPVASVPGTLAIPAGQTSGTFTINTSSTTVNVTATISAALNGLTATASLSVTKALAVGNATYDPALKAPRCNTAGAFCDTGGLIDGRGNMSGGAESNTPNTVAGSTCSDGSGGAYHSDESIDGLRVSTVDGTNLAPGKSVKIDATVWAFSSSDHLDLYLTTDATAASPGWTLLNATTITPTTTGATVLSFTTTLPATGGMSWAVRANFRFGGATALCTTGTFDDHDDVVFLVDKGTPPPNQPPLVNAGPDQTIALPAGATLNGAVSDDGLPNPPGVVTVTWSVISGPGAVTFANASLAATTATFSTAGTYVLRLTASDSALSTSDDVSVTVNPQVVNQAPVVNAGPDQTITLPATASLAGTATDDGLPNPPGTLTTTWTKVSGPGTVTFGNASARATTASFSAPGSYVLRLTASDSALSTSDDIAITVNAQVNTAPVANAGPDQTITLPSAANLSGSATDDGLPNPPGTVTTTWTKVSGPGTVTFGNAGARATTATFSAAGSYVLRLTASDSVLTGSDDIAITVNAASGSNPCAGLCNNPVNVTINGSYQSGNLGTGAVCLQTTSKVHGGNCGNFVSPRTLKVNGVTESCTNTNWSSVPAARNGGWCVQTTSGNQPWAFVTLF